MKGQKLLVKCIEVFFLSKEKCIEVF